MSTSVAAQTPRREVVTVYSDSVERKRLYCLFFTMGGVKKRLLDKRKQLKLAREEKQRRNEENVRGDACQPSPSGTTPTPRTPTPTPRTPTPTPTPTSSAKRRRLEVGSVSPAARQAVSDENIVLKKSYIEEMFSRVACKKCYTEKLKVHFVNKLLDFKFHLECEECGEKQSSDMEHDTPVTKAMIYSGMNVGLEYSLLNNFLGNMNMRPICNPYQQIRCQVLDGVQD